MSTQDWLKRRIRRFLLNVSHSGKPIHSEVTLLLCADDVGEVSMTLLELGLDAAKEAITHDLKGLQARTSHLDDSRWYANHPGDHYRFLAALIRKLQPKRVIEIGTYTGMSSAALLTALADDAKLVTFDILPWNDFATHLRQEDFDSGKISQVLGDLADSAFFSQHKSSFDQADFIFCDAPKDGVFEWKFLELLTKLAPRPGRILMLDDIRLLNMVGVWKAIESPKVDLTSVGHWSGTGLVDLSKPLKFTGLPKD